MNAEQEKIFDTLRPYIQQYATGTIRSGIAEILAASTPALPGEVRLPSEQEQADEMAREEARLKGLGRTPLEAENETNGFERGVFWTLARIRELSEGRKG